MNEKPVIFVSSSTEAKKIDKLIRSKLEELDAVPKQWNDFDMFPPGCNVISKLLELTPQIDGALLIATADDYINCRGQRVYSPRDNIVFEMGVFLAQMGKQRAAIIHVKDSKINDFPKLPTNLDGFTTLRFEPEHPLSFDSVLSNWLEKVKNLIPKSKILDELNKSILPKLKETPEQWSIYLDRYVVGPFKRALDLINRGEVLLSIGEYYNSLYQESDVSNSDSEIMAVSVLPSKIWSEDKEQQQYINKNIEASNRGTKIRRLFVLHQNDWEDFRDVLNLQKKAGIEVKFSDPSILSVQGLNDMVIFRDRRSNKTRIYMVDNVLGNPHRMYGARLILDPELQQLYIDVFENVWIRATDYSLNSFLKDFQTSVQMIVAPGHYMEPKFLEHPVVNCKEAALARGIPLSNELKSLIFETSRGIICVHTTGDSKVSPRTIKELLEVKQAFLVSYEKLKSLGLSPGTVSAVLEPTWSLPYLINRRVLEKDYVCTNNGTLTGYFKFNPKILLDSPIYKIGEF